MENGLLRISKRCQQLRACQESSKQVRKNCNTKHHSNSKAALKATMQQNGFGRLCFFFFFLQAVFCYKHPNAKIKFFDAGILWRFLLSEHIFVLNFTR